MKKSKLICSLLALLFCSVVGYSQVSVVSFQLQPYNVTPEQMLSASIMNNGGQQSAQMISRLYSFNNDLIMTVHSVPFILKAGMNSAFDGSRKVQSTEYSVRNQAEFIKTTHTLPSGKFKICIDLLIAGAVEPGDQFCDEIESEFNQYLYLVTPFDKDTVETLTPLLVWNHSEPFTVLAQGESFRMLVAEIKDDQNAEQAITVNTPVMTQNYLSLHFLQYPYEAKVLIPGKRYAWQVQRMANGIIVNKTEAWEFITRKDPEKKSFKYVALRKELDASYYTAYDGKIYFKFMEEYNTHGNITAYIRSDQGKEFSVTISKDEKEPVPGMAKIKNTGDNRFLLDLDMESVKPGFYTMKIRNEKRETFYLKFYLPK